MFPNNRQSKPNTGALFDNDQRGNPNGPSMRGNFVLGEEVLSYVMQCAQSGRECKLEIAAFQKVGRQSGNRYLSLNINTPYELRKNQQGGQPNRPQYNAPLQGQQMGVGRQQQMSYGQHRGGPPPAPPVQSEDDYGVQNQDAPPWD